MEEPLQLLEQIATIFTVKCRSPARDRLGPMVQAARDGSASLERPACEATGHGRRAHDEHGARAAGASPEDQRPLSCLRIDELQASSFAGASEEATRSS